MTAQELSQRAELEEELQQAAVPEMPVREYIEQLARGERLREAVSVLAQALPKRDAIGWGLESVRSVEAAAAKPKSAPALQAVDAWVAEPSEERRRAAHEAAKEAGFGTPAGCLGLAVFLSGGSMAPPTAPVAPEPAPHVCGKTVAGAILMAAVSDPRNAAEHFRTFLDRGFARAEQIELWKEK
jgi:hypothetical protein